jgi:hypothetical protein
VAAPLKGDVGIIGWTRAMTMVDGALRDAATVRGNFHDIAPSS